jgi:hypothetical protein
MWLGLVATSPLGCMSSKYTPPVGSYSAPSVNTYPVASFVGVAPGGRIWADALVAASGINATTTVSQSKSRMEKRRGVARSSRSLGKSTFERPGVKFHFFVTVVRDHLPALFAEVVEHSDTMSCGHILLFQGGFASLDLWRIEIFGDSIPISADHNSSASEPLNSRSRRTIRTIHDNSFVPSRLAIFPALWLCAGADQCKSQNHCRRNNPRKDGRFINIKHV